MLSVFVGKVNLGISSEGGGAMQLNVEEGTAVLALYQQVKLQQKPYSNGEIPLEITVNLLSVLVKVVNFGPTSSEQKQLLSILQRVQWLVVQGRNRINVDLNLHFFPSLHKLTVQKASIRSITSAEQVVELVLSECIVEQPLHKGFGALRCVEFDRTHMTPKHWAPFSYTLRRIIIGRSEADFDKTLWRLPSSDDAIPGLLAWEPLTHLFIKGNRMTFKELDSSWEKLVSLTTLSIVGLGLTSLKELHVLHRCVNLLSLDLSNNSLESVASISVIASNVLVLNVAFNSLSTVGGLSELKKLQVLNLQGNQLTEWAELSELAEGCPQLANIRISQNPMLMLMKNPEQDKVPFTASIFKFRPLIVDGVRSEGTKRQVTPEFLSKNLALFERNRGPAELHSESGAHSVPSMRIRAPRPRGGAASMQSEQIFRQRRKIVRGVVEPDKSDVPIQLPPSQINCIDPASPFFVDVEAMKVKYGERWLTVVAQQTNALKNRGLKPKDAPPPVPYIPIEETKEQSLPPAPVAKKESKTKRTRASQAKDHPKDTSPQISPRGSAVRGSARFDQPAPHIRDVVAAERGSQLQTVPTVSRSQVVAQNVSLRQNPLRDPTPLFQVFLQSLANRDWAVPDEKGAKVKGFPSGCSTFLSAICSENEALWGISEESGSNLELHHTALEVLLHDTNDGEHKYVNSRHMNKTLVRVVEYHCGYTRTVRVESTAHTAKGELPDFSGRPRLTVLFPAAAPTQPVEQQIELQNITTGSSQNKRQPRASFRERATSDLFMNEGDDQYDASKISREVLRVSRPKLLVAFVVPLGACTNMFLEILCQHIRSCHSRLCAAGIMKEWPLYLDDSSSVKRDADRSVPIKASRNYVLERLKSHTDENVNRQRIGCNMILAGEELPVHLKAEIFKERVKSERIMTMVYANYVTDRNEEDAGLIVATDKTVLVAKDRNYHRGQNASLENCFESLLQVPFAAMEEVRVAFNLQALSISLDRSHDEVILLLTRDAGSTMAILSAMQSANPPVNFVVTPCTYPSVTGAPLIFSIGLFMRQIGQPKQQQGQQTSFPLRHLSEKMQSITLVLTTTEILVIQEKNLLEDAASSTIADRRPLASVLSFGVAEERLHPLVFSLRLRNREKGSIDTWIFAAQHPNSIAFLYAELRQQLGAKLEMLELSEREYNNA